MSKITIPKEAMKYATRLASNDREFNRNSDKFADIMHQHYPHLSRYEIDEINYQITLKGIKVSTVFEILDSKKKEMYEVYKSYSGYKKRGDYENAAILENNYKKVYKKYYDYLVDELRQAGHNTRYAPDNLSGVKYFCMWNKNEIEACIISVVILGLISLLYI